MCVCVCKKNWGRDVKVLDTGSFTARDSDIGNEDLNYSGVSWDRGQGREVQCCN